MKKQKILVVSDTHKMHVNFDLVLEKEKPFDVLFHAGDVEGREWEIEYGSGEAGKAWRWVTAWQSSTRALPKRA